MQYYTIEQYHRDPRLLAVYHLATRPDDPDGHDVTLIGEPFTSGEYHLAAALIDHFNTRLNK